MDTHRAAMAVSGSADTGLLFIRLRGFAAVESYHQPTQYERQIPTAISAQTIHRHVFAKKPVGCTSIKKPQGLMKKQPCQTTRRPDDHPAIRAPGHPGTRAILNHRRVCQTISFDKGTELHDDSVVEAHTGIA